MSAAVPGARVDRTSSDVDELTRIGVMMAPVLKYNPSMPLLSGDRPWQGVALVFVAFLSFTACGGSSSSPAPPTNPPGGSSGTVQVRGSEKLSWDQAGDVSELQFVAYVDDVRVALDSASCNAAQSGPQGAPCLSPLPDLANGVHKIELAAVFKTSQQESARSAAITVQKVPAITASGTASATRQGEAAGLRSVDGTLTLGNGLTFDVRIVARGLEAPTQMAFAPDGRLFVAERGGRIQVLETTGQRAGELTPAFDANTMLDRAPGGSVGLALHPEFARNRFVYLGQYALDRNDQAVVQAVRLREIGDTLGEPAVVFEERLETVPRAGPLLRFGPDRRLYIGLQEWAGGPGDTRQVGVGGAFLRVSDDGRISGSTALFSHGSSQPLGLDWSSQTQSPWAVLAEADGRATLRAIGAGPNFGRSEGAMSGRGIAVGGGRDPGGLLIYRAAGSAPEEVGAFVAVPDNEALWFVGLDGVAAPELLFPGTLGRIGDIVQAHEGALFISTRNRDGRGTVTDGDDVIVRLKARKRSGRP
jgi:glucose/arabinose dehydrogenase